MKECRYGAFFFGLGLAKGPLAHLNVEAMLRLATDLHQLRESSSAECVDMVTLPALIVFSAGRPGTRSALICREDILDISRENFPPTVYFLVKNRTAACSLEPTDCRNFRRTPSHGSIRFQQLCLDMANRRFRFIPVLKYQWRCMGVHCSGTAYRMDEIPIPLRAILDSNLPVDVSVLQRILSGCRSILHDS